METVRIRYTRGDHATQPGGVILRRRDDGEYVAHHFNRDRGSKVPREFYWGRYSTDEGEATRAFDEKVARARQYDRGGSLIPEGEEDAEIAAEL